MCASGGLFIFHRACTCKLEVCWPCTGHECTKWRLSDHAQGVRMQSRGMLAMHRACACKLDTLWPCTGHFSAQTRGLLALHRVRECLLETSWPCTGCACANWRLSGHAQEASVHGSPLHTQPTCGDEASSPATSCSDTALQCLHPTKHMGLSSGVMAGLGTAPAPLVRLNKSFGFASNLAWGVGWYFYNLQGNALQKLQLVCLCFKIR